MVDKLEEQCNNLVEEEHEKGYWFGNCFYQAQPCERLKNNVA